MSDLYDVEEADQEAAERLRVHEWAAEHQNPLTAALQRAETAEERAAALNAAIVRASNTEILARLIFDAHVLPHHKVPFAGLPRDVSIRAAQAVQAYLTGGAV